MTNTLQLYNEVHHSPFYCLVYDFPKEINVTRDIPSYYYLIYAKYNENNEKRQ